MSEQRPFKAVAVRQRFFARPAGGVVFFCPKCKLRHQIIAATSTVVLLVRCKVCETAFELDLIDKAIRDDPRSTLATKRQAKGDDRAEEPLPKVQRQGKLPRGNKSRGRNL